MVAGKLLPFESLVGGGGGGVFSATPFLAQSFDLTLASADGCEDRPMRPAYFRRDGEVLRLSAYTEIPHFASGPVIVKSSTPFSSSNLTTQSLTVRPFR